MGYERKRGKLMQFNAFLRGRCAECVAAVVGDQSIWREIKYVITLDTDTQLPRESARQLIGTMAHPLNRPQFDPARGIVTEGYGLLQPRVDVSLPTADRSRFVRLHAGDVGIDPYTRTVSDVYQDLFGEGSFIGKGVYDVDAFQRALAGRFPENRILSHDLLESVYARCGLVSDVTLYEEYPSRCEIDAVRRHRWIRGDWQILPWLLPRVPDAESRGIRNPISALSWWKICDNLRRSLVPIALLLFFLASWLLVSRLGLMASCALLAIIAFPGLLSLGVELLRKPEQLPWRVHLRGMLASAKRTLSQIGLTLAFLPNDAFLSLTAIGQTLWRVFITRQYLLKWVTSGEVARSARTDLAGSYAAMWFAPAIALGGAVSLGLMQPARWVVALPFFALWLTAPWIAWWISLPIEHPTPELSVEQLTLLRRIARKTWHLFALACGLPGLAEEKVLDTQIFAGLRDTLALVKRLTGENPLLSQLDAELAQTPSDLRAAATLLQRAVEQSATISSALANREGNLTACAQTLQRSCAEHLDELNFHAPWLTDENLTSKIAQVHAAPSLREIATFDHLDGQFPVRSEVLGEASKRARERVRALETLASQCDELAGMDFSFLFDKARNLFAIGFNVTEGRRDVSFYDLLASEARLCSYLAIAEGQVPQEHWFALGRLLVAPGGEPILVSWSGSMFEYLMPLLVMPSYRGTLLDRACKTAVELQIEYGNSRGVPLGVSESGVKQGDVKQMYQYRAFGVPGLGLKRGLAEDLVIAPYATVLALMVAPREASENLQRLARDGREGDFGFYEAVDYTPSRLPPDESSATVRSYMAHHQGMSLLALVSSLRDLPMQRRFMSRPLLKAADLLLQERLPKTEASVLPEDLELEETRPRFGEGEDVMRVFKSPTSRTPEIHLLSNGRYHVAISNAGGGYSRWKDLAITRWREDATCDYWGVFLYLRDVATGEFWSAAHQPTWRATTNYEAIFTQARAEFRQRHGNLEIHTELSVSPQDDVEVRRVTLTNHSSATRTIELTSYAEVVLATQAADELHPTFSNLFVQTEFVPDSSAILCTRRARTAEEKTSWLLHLLAGQRGTQAKTSSQTGRARFVGRDGNLANPAAMQKVAPLSNTAGSVLDPIISLRRNVTLQPDEIAVLDFVIGAAENRETVSALVEKYQHFRMADRAFDLAWTHSQVILRQLNATEAEAQLYARLAGAIIYADPARRATSGILLENRRGQSALWAYGISGDTPLVLLRVTDMEKIELVRQLIRAHSYWRAKGLTVELVILNEDVSVYRQNLQDQITSLVSAGSEAQMLDKPGGIFVRRLEQIPNDDRVLLQSAARIVLDDEHGSLLEQLEHRSVLEPPVPAFNASRAPRIETPSPPPPRDLIFHNGLGGFTPDGHEYVITLHAGQVTPSPWVNVLANPSFGTVVSENGGAYTWFENAHEFRLTPWFNDPVRDLTGEAFYIRDEETGQVWSPTPGPARGASAYVVRHGFGYTVFEHAEHGIVSELWIYVAMDVPVKLAVCKLRYT